MTEVVNTAGMKVMSVSVIIFMSDCLDAVCVKHGMIETQENVEWQGRGNSSFLNDSVSQASRQNSGRSSCAEEEERLHESNYDDAPALLAADLCCSSGSRPPHGAGPSGLDGWQDSHAQKNLEASQRGH
jgi:hypothetical protein